METMWKQIGDNLDYYEEEISRYLKRVNQVPENQRIQCLRVMYSELDRTRAIIAISTRKIDRKAESDGTVHDQDRLMPSLDTPLTALSRAEFLMTSVRAAGQQEEARQRMNRQRAAGLLPSIQLPSLPAYWPHLNWDSVHLNKAYPLHDATITWKENPTHLDEFHQHLLTCVEFDELWNVFLPEMKPHKDGTIVPSVGDEGDANHVVDESISDIAYSGPSLAGTSHIASAQREQPGNIFASTLMQSQTAATDRPNVQQQQDSNAQADQANQQELKMVLHTPVANSTTQYPSNVEQATQSGAASSPSVSHMDMNHSQGYREPDIALIKMSRVFKAEGVNGQEQASQAGKTWGKCQQWLRELTPSTSGQPNITPTTTPITYGPTPPSSIEAPAQAPSGHKRKASEMSPEEVTGTTPTRPKSRSIAKPATKTGVTSVQTPVQMPQHLQASRGSPLTKAQTAQFPDQRTRRGIWSTPKKPQPPLLRENQAKSPAWAQQQPNANPTSSARPIGQVRVRTYFPESNFIAGGNNMTALPQPTFAGFPMAPGHASSPLQHPPAQIPYYPHQARSPSVPLGQVPPSQNPFEIQAQQSPRLPQAQQTTTLMLSNVQYSPQTQRLMDRSAQRMDHRIAFGYPGNAGAPLRNHQYQVTQQQMQQNHYVNGHGQAQLVQQHAMSVTAQQNINPNGQIHQKMPQQQKIKNLRDDHLPNSHGNLAAPQRATNRQYPQSSYLHLPPVPAVMAHPLPDRPQSSSAQSMHYM
ncbi:hypothetical protein BJ170DRAFT_682339 [Xylariales sp. AK1849]|nr:hypothetical protein BJ170DRAFT_682339 [Xylariales sp. AK1849]